MTPIPFNDAVVMAQDLYAEYSNLSYGRDLLLALWVFSTQPFCLEGAEDPQGNWSPLMTDTNATQNALMRTFEVDESESRQFFRIRQLDSW